MDVNGHPLGPSRFRSGERDPVDIKARYPGVYERSNDEKNPLPLTGIEPHYYY